VNLPKIFGLGRTLAFAILAERWLGIPFALQAEGLDANPVPWHWLVIELKADEIIFLMKICAEIGARPSLMFLNGVLQEMQTQRAPKQV
jgi:hypothetical protein